MSVISRNAITGSVLLVPKKPPLSHNLLFHVKIMPYVSSAPKTYENTSVGDGQCVAFVRTASHAPPASAWRRGEQVKTTDHIAVGTVIATFDDNALYGNRKDGTSHAAIFLRKNSIGIVVLDQWITNGVRQPVHERTIRFGNVAGKKINNGDEYYVVD